MKHCVYCSHQIKEDTKYCPYCGKEVTPEATNSLFRSNIKCIKCGSSNVNYEISNKKRGDVIFEDEEYTCNDCGKKFTDWNRLGPSFNNSPQIILDSTQKKFFTGVAVVIIATTLIISKSIKKINEENNWEKMSCSGLPAVSFKQIKEGAPYDDDKYKGNSYIFTTTIQEINGNEIVTPIEEGDYTGSYIKVNKADLEKLSNYKPGDSISFCGTVKKN